MTTSSDTSVPETLRGWAASQLDVGADASPAALRQAVLRGLADEDFVPPDVWKPALDHLLCRGNEEGDAGLEREFLHESADGLEMQLETFSQEFAALEPDERRRRYHDLERKVGRMPRLALRLRRLEKGLNVPCGWDEGLEPDVKQLAAQVWATFLLPYVASARRRQEYLAAAEGELPRWEAAARRLVKFYPRLAALDTGLVQDLLIWRDDKARRVKARAKAAAAKPAPTPSPSASPSFSRGWWVLIAVVLGVIRMGLGGHSSSDPPKRPRAPVAPTPVRIDGWKDPVAEPFDPRKLQRILDEAKQKKDPLGQIPNGVEKIRDPRDPMLRQLLEDMDKIPVKPMPDAAEKRPPVMGPEGKPGS